LAALCRLLPERDPHPGIHAALDAVLEHLDDAPAANVVRFELMLLAELGFGLELDACAATGTRANLIYVSPKSGRAVSAEAGAPWRDKLLPLPAFLHDTLHDAAAGVPSPQDLADGFALTGFFLTTRVWEPRGLTPSEARAGFVAAVLRALAPV